MVRRFAGVVVLRRRPAYYLWNIVLPNLLCALAGTLALVVPPEDFATRAGLVVTMMLTVEVNTLPACARTKRKTQCTPPTGFLAVSLSLSRAHTHTTFYKCASSYLAVHVCV